MMENASDVSHRSKSLRVKGAAHAKVLGVGAGPGRWGGMSMPCACVVTLTTHLVAGRDRDVTLGGQQVHVQARKVTHPERVLKPVVARPGEDPVAYPCGGIGMRSGQRMAGREGTEHGKAGLSAWWPRLAGACGKAVREGGGYRAA